MEENKENLKFKKY